MLRLKRKCERQPSRVSKSPEWFREPLRRSFVDTRGTERLGSRQIETKEVTAVVPHSDILTKVDTCVGRRAQLIDHEPIMPLARSMTASKRVQLLYFADCPNHDGARELCATFDQESMKALRAGDLTAHTQLSRIAHIFGDLRHALSSELEKIEGAP